MATWNDGGNDWYTKNQLDQFNSQIQAKQQQLQEIMNRPAYNNRFMSIPSSALYKKEIAALQNEISNIQNQMTSGRNADGSYVRGRFQGITNPDGTLQDQYKLGDWQDVMPDTAAMDQYGQTAMRDAGSLSPWAQTMMDKMAIDTQKNFDSAAKQNAQGLLSAQSQLAQTGGLSGAARERMARTSTRDAILNRQNISRTAQTDKYNLLAQDEKDRMSQLQAFQGMQNTKADAAFKNAQMAQEVAKINLQNQIGEVDKQRMWDNETWKTNMQTWAANKSADAQAKAASSGGGKK